MGRPAIPKMGLNRNQEPIGVYSYKLVRNGKEVRAYEWRFMYKGEQYKQYGYMSKSDAMKARTDRIKEVCYGIYNI